MSTATWHTLCLNPTDPNSPDLPASMPPIPYARDTIRLALQLVAIALVVGVPWLLYLRMLDAMTQSQESVSHAADMISTVSGVNRQLNDIDSTVGWLALFPGRADLIEQIAPARARIRTGIAELARLTDDDAAQGARAASLSALIDARQSELDHAIELIGRNNITIARELLSNRETARQLRSIGAELVDHELLALAERRNQARQSRTRYMIVGSAFALGQLLLLALIVGLSQRQYRRHLQLETRSAYEREQADLILRTIRKPIAMLDQDLRVEMRNPAFQKLYANNQPDITGSPIDSIGNGAWSDAAVLQTLRDVIALDKELWDYELHQDIPGAGPRIITLNARRMPGSNGQGDHVIVGLNDITVARTAEVQIRELNEILNQRVTEVSEANRELEAFSYTVSHDLRAPLRHIVAYALKLERELGDAMSGKSRGHLDVIAESARRMDQLIDAMLQHSRLGRGDLHHAPVDMGHLVDEARNMLDADAPGAAVHWNIGPLPVVMGDVATLRLLWQNLLGNAVKYSARRDQPRVEVSCRHDSEAHEYIFRVADNGVGFDMAYADKLFGMFQRLHSEKEFPGHGIGLANVRRVVARHGGRIWATGTPDHGAIFQFTLPDRVIGSPEGGGPS